MLLAGPFTFDHCAAKPLCYLFFNWCLSQLCGPRGNCLYNEGVLTWNVCYVLRFHIDNFSFHFMPHNEDCSCCWHCPFDEQASIFFPSWLPISYELFSVCHLLILHLHLRVHTLLVPCTLWLWRVPLVKSAGSWRSVFLMQEQNFSFLSNILCLIRLLDLVWWFLCTISTNNYIYELTHNLYQFPNAGHPFFNSIYDATRVEFHLNQQAVVELHGTLLADWCT